MRYVRLAAICVALLGLIAAPAALADCSKKHTEATAGADNGGCCAKKAAAGESAGTGCSKSAAKAAALATAARNGNEKSAAKLYAWAKKSGCPKSHDLATRAQKGDEEARTELIAMYAGTAEE